MTKTRGMIEMPEDEYRDYPAVSQSELKTVDALSYNHLINGVRKESKALDDGRAYHTAMLEPEFFDDLYTVIPKLDRRSKIGRDKYKALEKEAKELGKAMISVDTKEAIDCSLEVLKTKSYAHYLTDGIAERCFFRTCPDTGLELKGRLDYVREHDDVIVDLKTTRCASEAEFKRSVLNYGYHIQAAFYMDLYRAHTDRAPRYMILCVEKQSPYEMAIYELSPKFLIAGRNAYKRALRKYFYQKTTADRGYPNEMQKLEPAEWFWRNELNAMEADDE